MATQYERPSVFGVRRSRGMVNGVLLVILGAWGALIPLIGPLFDFAFTPHPNQSWHFTWGRFWLEIVPGGTTVLAGLILLLSANRLVLLFGAWIGALAGGWFVVGPTLSVLWHDNGPWGGIPASSSETRAVLEQLGFFLGTGTLILFLASITLGRMTIVGQRDMRPRRVSEPAPEPVQEPAPEPASEPAPAPARETVVDPEAEHTT